jgi:hypothetical protein
MGLKKEKNVNGFWSFLFQDEDKMQAVVNMVIIFVVRKIQEFFLAAEDQLVFKKDFAL